MHESRHDAGHGRRLVVPVQGDQDGVINDMCGTNATFTHMGSIASRDLRNHTADALRRVREGERVIVTVHGEAVAELVPPPAARRPTSISRAALLSLVDRSSADPALRDELRALGDESTDDLGTL